MLGTMINDNAPWKVREYRVNLNSELHLGMYIQLQIKIHCTQDFLAPGLERSVTYTRQEIRY